MTRKANVIALETPGPWGTLVWVNSKGERKSRHARHVAMQGKSSVWEMTRSNGDTGHATVTVVESFTRE